MKFQISSVILFIVGIFAFCIKAEAFSVGDLQYSNYSVITPYKDGFLTSSHEHNFSPITVKPKTPGRIITNVKLIRKSDNQPYADLINVGDDQWKISKITGISKPAHKTATSYSGYFAWFRDPDLPVWAYDLPGQDRILFRTQQITDYPVPNMMRVEDPADTTGPVHQDSHIAEIHHDAQIGVSYLDLEEDDNIPIPIEKASKVHVKDNEVVYDTKHIEDNDIIPHLIRKDDIVSTHSDAVDVINGIYKFRVKAKFNNDRYDEISNTPDTGRVIKWYDGWKFVLRGEVYFVPELTVVAEEGDPPNQPDLTVTSLTVAGCPKVGEEGTYNYEIWNKGAATITSFKVTIRADGTEIATHTFTGGLGANEKKKGTFRYTFTSKIERTFTVQADSNNDLTEIDKSNNAESLTFKPCDDNGPGPKPPDLKIDGDFFFSRNKIFWTENLHVFPDGIEVTGGNGCAYASHEFRFVQGGIQYTPRPPLSPKDKDYFFQYDSFFKSYGGGIKKGTVTTYMKVYTTCGQTLEVGPKTFEIVDDPSQRPPELDIAWYANGKEILEPIPEGTIVELKVKKETDPDNDVETRIWYFNEGTTDWIKGLPAQYKWREPHDRTQYSGITASVQGSHKVCAVAFDSKDNASNKACAYLDVIGPNPVPVIKGGTVVKVNRTLKPPLDSLSSYSPFPDVMIDHSRDEWFSAAVWDDGTTSSWVGHGDTFNKEGKITVSLHVFDSMGRKSVNPDYHDITVIPDQPPVIEFEYYSTMIRSPQTFRNASYSPDGDGIEKYKVSYGYDWNNNGSCNVYETDASYDANGFTFNPTRVGNYCFRVYAKEPYAYGKDAFKDYRVEVINDNPEVSFTVTGEASEPNPVNVVGYNPNDLANGWTNTSLDRAWMFNSWAVTPDGALISSRRKNVYEPSSSTYSLPFGNSNVRLQGKKLQLPSAEGAFLMPGNLVPVGNDTFVGTIAPEYGGSKKVYLINEYEAKLIGETEGDSLFNLSTQELMLLYKKGPYNYANEYVYFEDWSRYSLNDLRNGTISKTASSYRYVSQGIGAAKEQGTVATWSDGTRPGFFSRLPFREDFKEINLSTRTIKSYTEADKVNPYNVITYDTMPALPRQGRTGMAPPLQWYPETSADVIFSTTLDGTSHNDQIKDARQNFYKLFDFDGSPKIVRFDAFSGIPAIVGDNLQFKDYKFRKASLAGMSEDGNVAKVSQSWDSYDDDYGNWVPSGSESFYIDLRTGNVTGAPPAAQDFSGVFQNGYAYKQINGNYQVVEATHNTPVGDNSIFTTDRTFVPKIISDNEYIDARFEQGKELMLYKYNPSEEQPAASNEPFTFGQLINPWSQQVTNGTMIWAMKTKLDNTNYIAGMGFRIQNHQNMYRLESHKKKLNLVKIVNGRKTVLVSVARTAARDTWIPYRIKLSGNSIKVYENNNLIMDTTDSTFGSGTMGPFSTADDSQFKSISFQWTNADSTYATPGTAIVDTAVKYDTTYTDPESDPRLDSRTQWYYEHIDPNKFLDIGDGKSGWSQFNGRTETSPVLTFDKVGLYKISYRVPDDPHPDHRIANGDLMFEHYSKYSDWYAQNLIVHRRPISNFTITQAGQDGNRLILWTDYSYDPDRCYNAGSCQNQSDYPSTRGIYQKKFYYITPSGQRVDGKLVRPTESGTYVVAMAVADEYKAWSDWFEQTIDICNGCQAAPNNPPNVQLTFPSGTFDNPSHVSLQPTITWNQWDADPGTVYETFDLNVKDEWGNCVECIKNQVMGTTRGDWAWTMDNLLVMGRKYSAQVRVSDGEEWSGWSNIGWMATNSPPSAFMSFPWGTQDQPNIINTTRPRLTWVQTDPDAGTWFHYYQIQIINESHTTVIYDSGKVWQNTQSNDGFHDVPVDLPTGKKMRVHVKVWDQYGAESNWSPQTWMMINRPPVADFDWTPKPAFEGDTVQLINLSTDPDGDAMNFEWQIKGPVYEAVHSTSDAAIPSTATDHHPGDYLVTLKATDIHGASDTVSKVVRVGDLILQGFVKHTPQWDENRKSYNIRKTGDAERPRPYDMFWAGEAFVLEAATNEPAASVTVRMSYTELEQQLAPDPVRSAWNGKMTRDDFETLPDQTYSFRFQAFWPNGHTETAIPVITISDPWTGFTTSVRKE